MNGYINGCKVFDTVKAAKNTAEYVIARLVDIGIEHSFSIPGDFAFAVDHALINNPKLTNIINANELNASYSADGYARVKGAAILSTTYAVGELSALNGVMGAKAENNVIFHIVGAPPESMAAKHKQVHHTLGNGVFGNFKELSEASCCVSATITPDNARREMNRVIKEVFKYRMPAYISIALDIGNLPVTDQTEDDNSCCMNFSSDKNLNQAVELVLNKIYSAKKIAAVVSVKLDRWGITDKVVKFIEQLDIPFAIMPHDKSVITEYHRNYAGFYAGAISDKMTSDIVENADLILNLGDALWSDFNTGGFTNNLNLSKVLNIGPFFVETSDTYIPYVYFGELFDLLIQKIKKIGYSVEYKKPLMVKQQVTSESLTLKSFYNQLAFFLEKNDTLVVETGSSSLNLAKFPLPEGVKYHNQTLWGSIGWGTPATLGIALAKTESRVILVTGEGAHQLTLNELGIMGRYKINPIIFCINNNGFMVERALELNPDPSYDDLAQLNYSELPKAFGCSDWLTFKIKTELELAEAMKKARNHHSGTYIELITPKYDYGSALEFFNAHLKEMYS